MECQQRFPNRLGDQLPDFRFAMKFHLALGRMNVYIHRRRINFQEQAADRVTALHQRRVITFDERVVESAVFHRAAVDKNKLAVARRAGNAGRAGQAPNPEFGFRSSDFSFFSGDDSSNISTASGVKSSLKDAEKFTAKSFSSPSRARNRSRRPSMRLEVARHLACSI